MIDSRTKARRYMLAGMSLTGVDRLYQQLDSELGFILTLHRVRTTPSHSFLPNGHLEISPDFLQEVLEFMQKREVEIISMDELAERVKRPACRQRFCAITFDDGYLDTISEALPVLRQFDAAFTVYVAGGLVEGVAHLWWEKLADLIRANDSLRLDFGAGIHTVDCTSDAKKHEVFELVSSFLQDGCPELESPIWFEQTCAEQDVPCSPQTPGEIMGWEDVRTLAANPLCTIGAHSMSHYALARLPEEIMRAEISDSLQAVYRQTGERPRHFAYPYGFTAAAGKREFDAAADAGLLTAVTTRPGMIFAEHADHMTALPRISANGYYQNMRHFAPLTTGLPTRLACGLKRLDVA